MWNVGGGKRGESYFLHPTFYFLQSQLLLFFAGEDFGDVERVVVDAAIGAEHIGYHQAEKRHGFAGGQPFEVAIAEIFHHAGELIAAHDGLVADIGSFAEGNANIFEVAGYQVDASGPCI